MQLGNYKNNEVNVIAKRRSMGKMLNDLYDEEEEQCGGYLEWI